MNDAMAPVQGRAGPRCEARISAQMVPMSLASRRQIIISEITPRIDRRKQHDTGSWQA